MARDHHRTHGQAACSLYHSERYHYSPMASVRCGEQSTVAVNLYYPDESVCTAGVHIALKQRPTDQPPSERARE